MLRCKQVSDALASGKYWDLPLWKRVGLKLHVYGCVVCGPFNRFIMVMQDTTRHYIAHEQSDPVPPELSLSSDAKERMAKAVKEKTPSESD